MKLIGRNCRETSTLPFSISPDSSATSTKTKKSKKRLADVKSFSLDEPLQAAAGDRSGNLHRSKTYDQPPSGKSTDQDTSERRRSITTNLPKHNVNFHKLFRDVSEEEELKDSFNCALQKEVLYHGRFYISSNYLGFYCTMLRKEIKILIPVKLVILVKKANTALLVPNALSVKTTEGDKYLFGSLRNRELCYQTVRAVCPNLQDPNAPTTPLSNCAEQSSEKNKTSNSSHSDLEQQPQESNSAELCNNSGSSKSRSRLKSTSNEVDGVAPNHWSVEKMTEDPSQRRHWVAPSTVNLLLIIYMLLVVLLLVSSGYIGLRIMELENQLSIMGAWPNGGPDQWSPDT